MADLSDKWHKYQYEFVHIDSKKIFIKPKYNCG